MSWAGLGLNVGLGMAREEVVDLQEEERRMGVVVW